MQMAHKASKQKGVQEPYVLGYRQSRGEAQGVEDIEKGSSCGYMSGGEVDEAYLPWKRRMNPVWPETEGN